MTKKEAILKSILEMDIEMLHILLDDKKSYMDVSKEAFIDKLNEEFNKLKSQGLNQFSRIIKGYCSECNKGCGGYSFLTENNDAIDLLFEEENSEILDIYLCSVFINEEKIENKNNIFFLFYEDEKTNFQPSIDLILKMQSIQGAEDDFNQFKNKITYLEDFCSWHLNYQKLFKFSEGYNPLDYKFLQPIWSLHNATSNLYELINKHSIATKAINEFKYIDLSQEKDIIKWLIKYENNKLSSSFGYVKIENWEQNNLIFMTSDNSVIIDCSNYSDSLFFENIYETYSQKILERYKTTEYQFE